jgi:hypothetical protein
MGVIESGEDHKTCRMVMTRGWRKSGKEQVLLHGYKISDLQNLQKF